MSHYSKIETQIVEVDSLLKALAEMGYGEVEVHDSPQRLYGYQGDMREEKANVIIRRKNVSQESNDIGFRKTDSGPYEAVISEYDQELLGSEWLNQVSQLYAEYAVVSKLSEQGFSVAEKRVDPATLKVHLVLRRNS
jgi:hypothetical protein